MSDCIDSGDEGMTLVELLVVVFVSALVLTMIAIAFGNGLAAQQKASDRNEVTAELNAASAAITETVRDAADIRILDDGTVATAGNRLDARALKADGSDYECVSWALVGDELRYSAGDSPRSADPSSWTVLVDGVEGNLADDHAFEGVGDRMSFGFTLAQGQASVDVTNGAVALAVKTGGRPCW